MAEAKKFYLSGEPNGVIPELIDPERKKAITGLVTSLAGQLNQDPVANLSSLLSIAEVAKLVTNDEADLYYMYTFASLIKQGIFSE